MAKPGEYIRYLRSPCWRSKRADALLRDKARCRACGAKAIVVHHTRYPRQLGDEPLDWLLSLCTGCHDEIHRLTENHPLSTATRMVLDGQPGRKPKRKQKRKPSRGKVRLRDENEKLHAIQVANREKRQRRRERETFHVPAG